MTHEERLREAAVNWHSQEFSGSPWKAALDAGATALAITREIAKMDPNCLYTRCVTLHREKP